MFGKSIPKKALYKSNKKIYDQLIIDTTRQNPFIGRQSMNFLIFDDICIHRNYNRGNYNGGS